MTIAAGTEFGPYRIIEHIGSGGMGEVYRAIDARLQRDVAIKFVSDSFLAGEISSGTPVSQQAGTPHSRAHLSHERFLREARSAATLSHPNICAIHDIGEQDGRPYLVMELLRGSTLKDVLKQGPLSANEVIAFAVQAASALAAAHAKGIIHRDIKPANLFVADTGRGRRQIKILDFGLAKKQGIEASPDSRTFDVAGATQATAMQPTRADLTSEGSTVGTVAYMSPEQARGAPLDARTDLFSLGSVIYEMAAGQSPFGGGSTADVFAALLMKDPVPISRVNPAMPKELDPIVAKLLAKDKEQRYASAEDLLADLETIPVSGGVAAATSGSQKSASAAFPIAAEAAGAKRRNMRIVLAVLAVIVAAAVLIPVLRRHLGGAATAAGDADNPAGKASSVSKDSIIVADFVNNTGDPVFDTTLNQALSVQLGQSPVLTLVSQRHLRQSLQFLGKKQDEVITPAIAREIGEREGVKAILTGTISSIGKAYLITLVAQNTATGDDIATAEAQAADKDHVLDALNTASAEMRAKLGESLSSIKKLNTPFGQATTPSLEAFRAYALGDTAHQRGDDIPEAEGHYKRALELDPKLAMAWARLGVIYLNSGQTTKALEYFTKAHILTANVSEREKLYIDGHYYTEVLGDLNSGIETLEEATQTYPLVVDNFVNLGVALVNDGQLEKAQDYQLKALALQPDDAVVLENAITGYGVLDNLPKMREYIAQADKVGLNGTTLLALEMIGYALAGDTENVRKILTETSGRPDQFFVTGVYGNTRTWTGNFKEAEVLHRQAAQQASDAKAVDAQASWTLTEAAAPWMVGRCNDVSGAAQRALALDRAKATQRGAAAALALCGDKQALPMLAELEKKYPQDTLVQEVTVPGSRAALLLKEGQPQAAIALLAKGSAHDLVTSEPYLRGLAYMQLHDAQNAIAALKIATKYKGTAGFTGIPPALAQLQLGRAYAMAGDKANAKKCYDYFFATWKNADSDLPVIAEAKKEYAAL